VSERIRIEKGELDHGLRLQMEEVGREIAVRIDNATGGAKRVGYVLLMTEFGEGGWTSYISNCQRADMNKLLREFLKHSEEGGQNEIVGPRS